MRSTMLHAVSAACAAILLLATGCADVAQSYRAPGHDIEKTRVVLVLPFLDTRSVTDADRDPTDKNAVEAVRRIFVEEFQKNQTIQRKILLAPMVERPGRAITTTEAIEYGRKFNADMVVAGQLFFYLDGRSVDIPPRAGMFVRIFSVPENRLVFTGENYVSGVKGGKAEQARIVASTILANYTAGTTGAAPAPEANAPKVLVLPYYDAPVPNNQQEAGGGAAIITAIYSMELELSAKMRLMTPPGAVSHQKLATPEEAIALGKAAGADFVLRGSVLQFLRAKDQASWLWGTYGLVVQYMLAQIGGADVVTEVYRVSDGHCIYAKRQTQHMKYRVRTEVTVRDLAKAASDEIVRALSANGSAKPLIETTVAQEAKNSVAVPQATGAEAAKPEPARRGPRFFSRNAGKQAAEKSDGDAAPTAAPKAVEKPVEKPAEKPVVKTTEKPAAKPVEQPVDTSSNHMAPKPTAAPVEKAVAKPAPEPVKTAPEKTAPTPATPVEQPAPATANPVAPAPAEPVREAPVAATPANTIVPNAGTAAAQPAAAAPIVEAPAPAASSTPSAASPDAPAAPSERKTIVDGEERISTTKGEPKSPDELQVPEQENPLKRLNPLHIFRKNE